METNNKKNSPVVFYILGFIVAVFFELYWINNFPFDYFMIIGIGFVVLITGYLSFDSLLKLRMEDNELKREQNETMIKAQKAIYLATKKNTAETENVQIQNLKAINMLMDRMVENITAKQLETKSDSPADMSKLIDELTASNARLAKEVQNAVTVNQLLKANENLIKNVQDVLSGNIANVAKSTPAPAPTYRAAETPADISSTVDIPADVVDIPSDADIPADVADIPSDADIPADVADIPSDADIPADVVDIPSAVDIPADVADIPSDVDIPADVADIPSDVDIPADEDVITDMPVYDEPAQPTLEELAATESALDSLLDMINEPSADIPDTSVDAPIEADDFSSALDEMTSDITKVEEAIEQISDTIEAIDASNTMDIDETVPEAADVMDKDPNAMLTPEEIAKLFASM